MRDTPGWNLDGFRNVVSIIARVEPGEEVAAAAQASAALERRVSLVGLDGGDVAPTERRIAYALAGVSVLVLVIGLANAATLLLVRGTRAPARVGHPRGPRARRADGSLPGSCSRPRSSRRWQRRGALVLSSWLGEAVRRLLLAGVIENDGLTPRTFLLALAAGLGALVLAAVIGRCSYRATCGRRSVGRRLRRASQPRLPDAALVQTTLSVVLIAGAGMLRPQSVQPDGAGLRDAPERRRPGRLRAGTRYGRGSGRDLQVGARARAVDARRRSRRRS